MEKQNLIRELIHVVNEFEFGDESNASLKEIIEQLKPILIKYMETQDGDIDDEKVR
jgi:hypothetical protein